MIEKCAAHGLEFPDFVPKDIFRELEMIGQTGNTVKFRCAAIDHFPGERDVILFQSGAASDAAYIVSHGQAPSGTDTVSYHARLRSG